MEFILFGMGLFGFLAGLVVGRQIGYDLGLKEGIKLVKDSLE